MISCKSLGAALALSATLVAPALAQEVIQEPGAFAFYHPNGDLRIATTPPVTAMASQGMRHDGHIAGLNASARMRYFGGRVPPARRD